MNEAAVRSFAELVDAVRALARAARLRDALQLIDRSLPALATERDNALMLKLDIALAAKDEYALAATQLALHDAVRTNPHAAPRLVASLRVRKLHARAWSLLADLDATRALAPEAFLLGVEFARAGDLATAEACYEWALRGKSDFVEAQLNLGDLQLARGLFRAAQGRFEAALALDASRVNAWLGLGQCLLNLGEGTRARAAFAHVPAGIVDAALLAAWRANATLQSGDEDAALALFEHALMQDPRCFTALFGLALIRERRVELDVAAEFYARAHAANPASTWALANHVYCLQRMAAWEALDAPLAALLARLRSGDIGDYANSTWIGFVLSGADQREVAARFAQVQSALRVVPVTQREFSSRDASRLRIGYLGADFRGHATSYLLVGVLERHDRARFEISAYALAPSDDTPVARRVHAACDRFVDVAGLSAAQVAARILEDRVDILIDLNGHTKGECMGLVALRPAPVIVNYLGFPGTMGAFADYIIGDRLVIPPGSEDEFSESVVRMPVCYQANDARREVGAATTRAAHGLPDDAIVACSFNQSWKFTPALWTIWMRLMGAHPRLVLWLLDENPWAQGNLRRHAQASGIAPGRIVFAPRVAHAAHLARLALADLALDTLPCNSHTTGSDALWMGVPLVTIRGGAFAGRVGASLLHAVGLPELVTEDEDSYAALLDALAGAPSRLAALKARLLAARETAPLFDSAAMARALEAAFGAMHARFAAGLAPAAVDIGVMQSD